MSDPRKEVPAVSSKRFRSDFYRVQQLIPATGWRMLLAWTETGQDNYEHIYTEVTHVVAWALLQHRAEADEHDVVPVILHPSDRCLTWDYSANGLASVLIQPGCEPTAEQKTFVKDYSLEIRGEEEAYSKACEKARELRREHNTCFEKIAELTGLSKADARQIVSLVDAEKTGKPRVSSLTPEPFVKAG